MTYNFNIHTGIFGDINLTLGFTSNSANTTKFIFGFNTNFDHIGLNLPRFSSSISLDFYDNFGNNTDIFKGIEGFSGGYFGSLGIGGSRTTSLNLTKDGLINADSGVNTTSISLGIGINGGQTTNYTHVCN